MEGSTGRKEKGEGSKEQKAKRGNSDVRIPAQIPVNQCFRKRSHPFIHSLASWMDSIARRSIMGPIYLQKQLRCDPKRELQVQGSTVCEEGMSVRTTVLRPAIDPNTKVNEHVRKELSRGRRKARMDSWTGNKKKRGAQHTT